MREEPLAGGPFPAAELRGWWSRFGLVAGVTERGDGEPFSLGLWTGEPVGRVTERWRIFRRAMAPRFPAVAMAHQVHGTDVRWHDGLPPGWHVGDGYDGHLTTSRGVLLVVTLADCVPIYLAHREGRGIGLLHAGWRGVAAGMLECGVRAFLERTGAEPGDLAVHLGVAICGRCYEAGPEVHWAVTGTGEGGPGPLDLRSRLAERARALGIPDVTTSPLCTSCHRDRFFSHRASDGRDGRMVAYLGAPLRAAART